MRKYNKFQRRNGNWFPTNSARSTKRTPGSCPWEKPGQTGKTCAIKNYFCRDQQKIFQVHCGLGRIEDQLPPPCSPARRPRSASICRYFNFIFQRILLHWWYIFHIGVSLFFFLSVSLPDTKQIVQESLGQVRIRIIVVVGVDVKRNQIIFILTSFSKKFHRI